MKKLWLSLATVTSAITPVVAVVSCANNRIQVARDFSIENLKEFKDITADGIEWNRGIAWHSFSQGVSFLTNLATELGWKQVEDSAPSPVLERLHASQLATPKTNYVIDAAGTDGSLYFSQLRDFGFNYEDAWGTYDTDGNYNDKTTHQNVLRVRRYAFYIDGAKNDGTVVLKVWATIGEDRLVKTYRTMPHAITTYPVIQNAEEIKSISKNVYEAIQKVKKLPLSSISMAGGFVNNDFTEMFKFINNPANVFTEEKVAEIVKKLNNGSHHLEAVMLFLSGVKNVPLYERPATLTNGKVVDYTQDGALNGLAKMNSLTEIRAWAHYANPDGLFHSYSKNK